MKLNAIHSIYSFLLLSCLMLACQSVSVQTESAETTKQSVPQAAESKFASLPFAPASNIPEKSPIIVSTDNGKNWKPLGDGLPTDIWISELTKLDEQLLIATQNHGLFIKAKDALKWQPFGTSLPDKKVNSLLVTEQKLYAGLVHHGIYQSDDKGKTWTSMQYNLPNLRVQAILAIKNRLLIGTEIGVYAFDENAKSWQKLVTDAHVFSLEITADKIIAETEKGLLLSSDLGKNWNWMQNTGNSMDVFLLDDQIIELSEAGQLFFSHDWGKNWLQSMHIPYALSNIFSIVKNKDTLLISNREGLLQSIDGGLTWEVLLQTKNPNGEVINLYQEGDVLYGGVGMGGC